MIRDIINFNKNWKFHLGDDLSIEEMAFGNQQIFAGETKTWQKAHNHGLSKPDNPCTDEWRTVDLPHDYVIEGGFTPEWSPKNGSLAHGKAWYAKKFELTARDVGKRIWVEFDGVYRDSMLWMNGHFIGRHMSGYTSFGYDLTDVCRFNGMNCLAMLVDATENELWSYEGGGIYRNVRLVKTNPVRIPQWGVFVHTGDESDPGNTTIEATVSNDSYGEACYVIRCRVVDPDGNVVATAESGQIQQSTWTSQTTTLETNVGSPQLWSLDAPTLYNLITEVKSGDKVIDRYEQAFGYRYFHFDPETGFSLNSEPMKLKGTCCHQDSAGVGVAVPPALQAWRVRRLKSIGCNAIRTSHNQPDPALLDACDKYGMLIMDEQRQVGTSTEVLQQLTDLIKRDRNHPSVILWSVGNEEPIHFSPQGIEIFRRMQDVVHKLDPSRKVTYAMNGSWIKTTDKHREAGFMFDVLGTNYRSGQRSEHYDEFHAKHPDWPMLGSETWGGTCTRGLYTPDKSTIPAKIEERWNSNPAGWADEKRYISAYANWCTPWGYTIEEMWQDCANRPFMAGTFVWTGFDYRGETSPYYYPAVITRFGVIDLCGFYKEVAHYLRAWWKPEEPYAFLMPHWNWAGHEGEDIEVWCYANSTEIELLLNGRSLGRKSMPVNGKLVWQVPYEAGELKAIGYNADGTVRTETVRKTALRPYAVELIGERTELDADGEDIVVVNATVLDKHGTVCPVADNLVEFIVEGPAGIIGVGNGDPMSHEPDKFTNQRKAFHGLCQVILKSTGEPGIITLEANSLDLGSGHVEIAAKSR